MGKKNVEINTTNVKRSKLLCPTCRKECMVYVYLHERIWGILTVFMGNSFTESMKKMLLDS
ncbi:MAG: hypothetical protein ACYDAO_02245 [Thermoplasmataceae archaeon]